jgi:hypothetical protein
MLKLLQVTDKTYDSCWNCYKLQTKHTTADETVTSYKQNIRQLLKLLQVTNKTYDRCWNCYNSCRRFCLYLVTVSTAVVCFVCNLQQFRYLTSYRQNIRQLLKLLQVTNKIYNRCWNCYKLQTKHTTAVETVTSYKQNT